MMLDLAHRLLQNHAVGTNRKLARHRQAVLPTLGNSRIIAIGTIARQTHPADQNTSTVFRAKSLRCIKIKSSIPYIKFTELIFRANISVERKVPRMIQIASIPIGTNQSLRANGQNPNVRQLKIVRALPHKPKLLGSRDSVLQLPIDKIVRRKQQDLSLIREAIHSIKTLEQLRTRRDIPLKTLIPGIDTTTSALHHKISSTWSVGGPNLRITHVTRKVIGIIGISHEQLLCTK